MIGTFWMHKRAGDVCIEIIKCQYKDDKKMKLKIRWWNLGYVGKPFLLTGTKKYTIQWSEWSKWVNIDDKLNVERKKPGLPE